MEGKNNRVRSPIARWTRCLLDLHSQTAPPFQLEVVCLRGLADDLDRLGRLLCQVNLRNFRVHSQETGAASETMAFPAAFETSAFAGISVSFETFGFPEVFET